MGLLLVVAANLPDADLAVGLFGRDHLVFSRYGITHSILGVVATSLLLAWLARRWCSAGFAALASLVFLAQAMHVLMDLSGAWGTQVLAPFSRARFALNWTPLADPLTWAILAVGLAAGLLAKERGPAVNGLTLAALLAYHLACGSGHAMAAAQFTEALTWLRVEPVRLTAFPQPSGPLRWSVVATESDRYYQAYVHSLDGLRGRIRVFFLQPLPAKLDGPFAEKYGKWAVAPLARPFASSGGRAFALCDLRFLGTRKGMPFVAKVEADPAGGAVAEWLPWQVTPPEADQEYELPNP